MKCKSLLHLKRKRWNICKVSDHCHYTSEDRFAAHEICGLKLCIAKEIPIVFRNGSSYDYHFIIKESAEEFEKQFDEKLFNSNRKRGYKNW